MNDKTIVYKDNHPFSPNYRGKIAAEFSTPRYPNRSHPPADSSRVALKGSVNLVKVRTAGKPTDK